MEPPAKRPRFGPAPFDDFDDPEADELNEQPEAVNARRDPAVQLERSRAFAAFKLKSAFERIFEKYEKDFTGVGDEIKLSTGEIVVDNGHIQSLKDAQLGDAEEGDGVSGDEGSEAGSLDGEDRLMRGKADNRLSSLGQNPRALIPQQLGPAAPPFLAAPWPGPAPMLAGTPGLPSMMYPGQMPLGGCPMQYATPMPMPTTDPTWKTPELPSPSIGNTLTWKEATATVRQKKARLSLSAAREADDGDEDDLLSKLPTGGNGEGKDQGLVVKQRVLLPRPPPEKGSVKKKKRKPEETAPKHAQGGKEFCKPQHGEKPPAKGKKGSEGESTAAPDRATPGPSPAPNPDRRTSVEWNGTPAAETPMRPAGPTVPGTLVAEADRNRSGVEEDAPGENQPPVVEPPRAVLPEPHYQLLYPTDPDIYIMLSGEGEEEKLTRKPGNQILRVEILSRNLPDVESFRILTPEPGEADLPEPPDAVTDELPLAEAAAVGVQDTNVPDPDRNATPESRRQAQAMLGEVFSRNVVDPAYAFSDEDKPTLPSRRQSRRKPNKPTLIKPVNAEYTVLREISRNIETGTASSGRDTGIDAPPQKEVETPAVREPSPTLSLRLDDIESPQSDHSKPGDVRDTPQRESVAETPEQKNDQFEQTEKRHAGSRLPTDQAASPFLIQSDSKVSTRVPESEHSTDIPEIRSSKTTGRGRPRKPLPRETPVRTPRRPETNRRNPAPQTRQEIPETSPNAQPAISSPSSTVPMSPILEIGDSDPPLSPEEPLAGAVDQLDRAPSPTLTDPTSKPQPSPSLPKPPQPSAAPRTPVKTTKRRLPKAATKPTTTTTATGTTKKKGILSLLPADKDDDDEEDELSIISPFRPASGPGSSTIRSTPAGHHVRLGLLAPRSSGGGRSATSTASKLKRAVLAGSAAAAGRKRGSVGADGFRTPSGRKEKGLGTPSTRLEEELVQTPGGTMRRCGEGGFRCEREFCFSCL